MVNIYIHISFTKSVKIQSSLQSSGKGGSGALRHVLCWEGHRLAEDCVLGTRQGSRSSTKEVQTRVGSCGGAAEAAEQQVWGEKTASTTHFSIQKSSAVFPWIFIFHYSDQVTAFVPPTLPQSMGHLECVTEMCNYPQMYYLNMDKKLDFPLETKACIVPGMLLPYCSEHIALPPIRTYFQSSKNTLLNEAFFNRYHRVQHVL